jgi:ABC-2 type transport system permease protein
MKIFWSFTRQAFQFIAAYRFNFFMEFVLVILRMYGIYWVWRTLYTQQRGAFGVSLDQMVTYGVMGMALEMFIWSRPQWYMANQIKSGAIDTDLMKPLDFHLYMLAAFDSGGGGWDGYGFNMNGMGFIEARLGDGVNGASYQNN